MVSLALRTVFLGKLSVSQEQAVSALVVLGFALSLVGAATLALSKRDTIILILTGAILWSVFVEKAGAFGLIRFIVFSLTIVTSLTISQALVGKSRTVVRLVWGAVSTGIVCGLASFVLVLFVKEKGLVLPMDDAGSGLIWGVLLGGSVGLGVSLGQEITRWLERRARS